MKIVRIIFEDIDNNTIAIKELKTPIDDIDIPEDGSWEEVKRINAGDGIALFVAATVEAERSSLEIMVGTFLAIEAKQVN